MSIPAHPFSWNSRLLKVQKHDNKQIFDYNNQPFQLYLIFPALNSFDKRLILEIQILLEHWNIKSEMRSFKSNENIHKKEMGHTT